MDFPVELVTWRASPQLDVSLMRRLPLGCPAFATNRCCWAGYEGKEIREDCCVGNHVIPIDKEAEPWGVRGLSICSQPEWNITKKWKIEFLEGEDFVVTGSRTVYIPFRVHSSFGVWSVSAIAHMSNFFVCLLRNSPTNHVTDIYNYAHMYFQMCLVFVLSLCCLCNVWKKQ